MRRLPMNAAGQGLGGDFWTRWCGQSIPILGSFFTAFVLPLMIYKITGSAVGNRRRLSRQGVLDGLTFSQG